MSLAVYSSLARADAGKAAQVDKKAAAEAAPAQPAPAPVKGPAANEPAPPASPPRTKDPDRKLPIKPPVKRGFTGKVKKKEDTKDEPSSTRVARAELDLQPPIWDPVAVGRVDPKNHQVALRGPLIALATNGSGEAGAKQPPGVFVLVGGVVRFFAPMDESAETLGVALDSDAVVFGVNWKDAAAVSRLGLDGAYDWVRKLSVRARLLSPPALLPEGGGRADVSVLFRERDQVFLTRLDEVTGFSLWQTALPGCEGAARHPLVFGLHAHVPPDVHRAQRFL